MNDSSGMNSSTPSGETGLRPPHTAAPTNWSEAICALLSARISLIQIESKAATRLVITRAALIVVGILATLFTWALLLAGGIATLAALTHWPWHFITLAVALIHALAAAICLRLASASIPIFPATCAEFQKDHEWLNSLHTPRKSND